MECIYYFPCCIYIYIYIYIGSISSSIQISLILIDIFCLHIFLLILSYCRIDFIVLYNTIKSIRQYERINKKVCRQKMSIMFNEIYIYIYIYISQQSALASRRLLAISILTVCLRVLALFGLVCFMAYQPL